MDFQGDPVSSTMHKVTPQPLSLQDTPGGSIHRAGSHSSPHSCTRSCLCVQHGLVPPADPRGRFANVNGAREITTIAAQYSTQVQHDQLISPDLAHGGACMGQRRTRPRGHDGLERLAGSPFPAQPVADLGSEVKFSHTGADESYRLLHDLRTNSGCIPNSVNFRRVLYRAKLIHQTINGSPTHALS